jgi:hypothetical protein
MNEKMLYEMAFTICRVIDDKRRLERENEHLKQQLEKHDQYLANSIREDEKFIGEIFTTMIKGIAK